MTVQQASGEASSTRTFMTAETTEPYVHLHSHPLAGMGWDTSAVMSLGPTSGETRGTFTLHGMGYQWYHATWHHSSYLKSAVMSLGPTSGET